MYTVTTIFSTEYRLKRSKFLGFLYPVSDETETEKRLHSIKKEHPSATHHCYACSVYPNNPVEFSSDDGEPAGLPILNTLHSFELINIILFVIRYYGGIKLGKPGLIEAYKTTARQVTESAHLKKIIPVKTYKIQYEYSRQSVINQLKHDFSWIELESSYLEKVTLTIGYPAVEADRFESAVALCEHQLVSFKSEGESFHVET